MSKPRITFKELWKKARADTDFKKDKSRLKAIFNEGSQQNQCLNRFAELVREYVPDMELELEKLGFYWHTPYSPHCSFDFYFNNYGDRVVHYPSLGLIEIYYKGLEKRIEGSDFVGEAERKALDWIRRRLD